MIKKGKKLLFSIFLFYIIIFSKFVFANNFIIYIVQCGDLFTTISRKCYGNIISFTAIL